MTGFVRAALTWSFCFASACAPSRPKTSQPNLLFVSIDTLRADHLGAYGCARPTSPRIDEFAKTAIVFDEAQSSSSWTLPSLASLMTSLYSSTHGQSGWGVATRLDPSFHTLAEELRNAGYDTAMVASQIFLSDRYGLQKGFTHIDSSILETETNVTSPEITERGIAWLREKAAVRDGIPWLLWLHYFDPHDEYLPHSGVSEKFGSLEPIDLYDGEIAFTDHYIGVLLDELDRLKLAGDTVVVIVADHGEEFGDHGTYRHGHNLFQEVVHVPLMVRIPGMMPRRVRAVVPTVDLMPTLLELCGTSDPYAIEGQSLLPLARGESQPDREAMSELHWHEDEEFDCVRVASWKYIEHHTRDWTSGTLFDLGADPSECVEATSDFADVTSDLRDVLARRRNRAIELRRDYRPSEASVLAPDEKARLKTLGYVGKDD